MIGFSSSVDSMPITILSLQENKPCLFFGYNSLVSINGVNRFYINEYKPIMRSGEIWEHNDKAEEDRGRLFKIERP